MADSAIPRIDPSDAMEALKNGALLVCAYEEPEKYARVNLKGSIPLQEFRKIRGKLDKDREIIFYCA